MNSRILYPGDGVTRLFQIPFPYLNRTHVKVYVNKVLQNVPGDYRFVSTSTIEFTRAPGVNDAVELIRMTELTVSLAQFQNGSVLTEDELNLATKQNLFLNQELRDYIDATLAPGVNRIATNVGVVGTTPEQVVDGVVQAILDSELLAELQTRITDIDLNATNITAQQLRLDTVEAVIDALASVDGESIATLLVNEQTARIAGDTALTQTLDLIGAKSGDSLSFILDLNKVKVSPSEALGTRLTGIQASLGANAAAIANEVTARTTADSSLASSVTTLQTTLNGNTAAIQAQQTTINGLSAQYTLRLDVNGFVTGYGLANSGPGTSEFIVLADKFAVVTPGATPVVPFRVDVNGVYIDTAYIRELTVDRITGGNISSQWNINDQDGRIVLDTGTHMKVIGVGFGANADLLEWFGPKMDISMCTRANGTTWVSTDGDAYFGGVLSAGVLKNSAASTQLSQTASVSTGTFGSNGGTRSVVCSFSLNHTGFVAGDQTGGSFPAGVTLTLRRGSTVLQTFVVSGGYVVGAGGYDAELDRTRLTANFGASFTFTDTSGGTEAEYSLTMSSPTGTWPRSLTNANGPSQRLSIISTEE